MRRFLILVVSLIMVAVLLLMIAAVGLYPNFDLSRLSFRTGSPLLFGREHEVSTDKEMSLEAAKRLSITNPLGKVTVRGANTDTISLTASIKARSNSQQYSRELLEGVTIETPLIQETRLINVKIPRTSSPDYVSVDLMLVVPRELETEISMNLGKLTVTDIQGTLKVHNKLGDAEIRNFSGNAIVQCDLGKISIRESEFDESLEVIAGLGDVTVEGSLALNTSITNRMGSVELRIPPDEAYNIDATMSLGSFDSSVPFFGEQSKNAIMGVIGNGEDHGRLTISVNLGSIRVSN